jgi:hypothetical protein
MMADPLLAQSAMDRLQSAAYELVVGAKATGNAMTAIAIAVKVIGGPNITSTRDARSSPRLVC